MISTGLDIEAPSEVNLYRFEPISKLDETLAFPVTKRLPPIEAVPISRSWVN